MKVDITRDSFDPFKNFTRVLMQQGRVQLDADWNEQVSIFWRYVHTFTRDLLGPYAGPEHNCGFDVLAAGDFPLGDDASLSSEEQHRLQESLKQSGDFLIGPGNYYVDGVLCSNQRFVHFSNQLHYSHPKLPKNNNSQYLIYLDVWEREVTAAEDPSIREVALSGADTAARAHVIWQVKVHELKPAEKSFFGAAPDSGSVKQHWHEFIEHLQSSHRGLLRARAHSSAEGGEGDPSTISPASQYRGPLNQLYRVEIHRAGTAAQKDGPTFKWSRENASVVFPIASFTDPVVTVTSLGRDARSTVRPGDWVEIVDDDTVFHHTAEPLRQVDKVDSGRGQVTLRGQPGSIAAVHPARHPILRRWDQKAGDPRRGGLELQDGAAVLKEGEGDRYWLALENGVQIQFTPNEPLNSYRTGDYWLIPARTALGDVIWPRHGDDPEDLPPRGVEHHYAPLAIAAFNGQNLLYKLTDCRPKFKIPKEY